MRLLSSCLVALALFTAGVAHAAPKLEGAVDGRLLLGVDGRYGGGLDADLWVRTGVLRVGGSFGVGALSKSDRATSRVFTPLALSLGLMPRDARSGPSAILRLGAYAGADKGGLMGGPYVAAALGYRVALGEGASVRLGVDAWALLLHDGGLFFGPYVGLGF